VSSTLAILHFQRKRIDEKPAGGSAVAVPQPKKDFAMAAIRSICVYCGSQPGNNSVHMKAAVDLGTAMGRAGLRLIYGGGAKGVMGAVADAVLAAGGEVTGIIPQFLIAKEASQKAMARLSETFVTQNMHQRKHEMFERADAFVALPGGIGTLEEIIEIMTWAQLGRHEKPILIANIDGFWDPLLALLDHMRAEGFIHTMARVQPLVVNRAAEIVPALLAAPVSPAAEGDARTIEKL
jgi:hypothetical protein